MQIIEEPPSRTAVNQSEQLPLPETPTPHREATRPISPWRVLFWMAVIIAALLIGAVALILPTLKLC
jgi:hypothetical protein